jgi:hypothetical protein
MPVQTKMNVRNSNLRTVDMKMQANKMGFEHAKKGSALNFNQIKNTA